MGVAVKGVLRKTGEEKAYNIMSTKKIEYIALTSVCPQNGKLVHKNPSAMSENYLKSCIYSR